MKEIAKMPKQIYKKLISILCFLSVILNTVKVSSLECNYIKNAQVYVNFALFSPFVPLNNTYEKAINGCLEEDKFLTSSTTKIGINCSGTEISMLGKNSIRNIPKLKSVYIYSCPIASIEQQAFTNVPKLEMIALMTGKVKEIQRGVFDVLPTLVQVLLRGHEIEYIEDFAFSGLLKLKVVDLSVNALRYLSSNWFMNSTNVVQLYLSYNFVKTVRQGTFKYVPNIQYLLMSHNDISTIDAGAFDGVSKLIYLDLGYNKLTTVSQNIFPSDLSMGYLILERNLINYLSVSFVKRILRNGGLKILGNPLKCSCLELMQRWMFEEKVEERLIDWSYFGKKGCEKSHLIPLCIVGRNSSKGCTNRVESELTKTYVQLLEKELSWNCNY